MTLAVPHTYTCIGCGRGFEKDRALRHDAKILCDVCRDECRKASKRQTWHTHKAEYRPTGQKILRTSAPTLKTPSPSPVVDPISEGLVDRMLPSGKRVVWQAKISLD